MLVKRCLNQNILEALKNVPVVFVNGPRQAGKSTLVKTLAKKAWPAAYVTFDEASQLGAAQANPESFLRGYEDRLILDEVQMVPDLFRPLKMLVDEARLAGKTTANGRYLLTGSAAILALPQLSNALVGRMDVLTLYPLSAVELASGHAKFLDRLFDAGFKAGKLTGGKTLMEMIRRSTFPEIMDADDTVRHRWYESYLTTILQREVHQIADIAKVGMLPNLLRLLASRAGSLINDADLARSLGQNAVTTKNYRRLLQMLFLAVDVPPWFRNIGKRLVKAPKGYLIDTSLLCHVQGYGLAEVAQKSPHLFGSIFENFVASELIKQLAWSSSRAQLFHFRTSDNKEVDFVLERPDGRLAGIDVKARDAVSIDDFSGLQELQAKTGEDFVRGIVLYRGRSIISFGDKLWAVPVEALWR